MDFRCERCGQVVPVEKFRVEGGVLVVTCQSCGAEGRSGGPSRPPALVVLEGGGQTSPEESLVPPPGHCPKCLEPRDPDALACARCGLVFANANEVDLAPPAELKERWEALVGRWSEDAEHERLLRYAASVGELAPLARLYRIWQARQPEDLAAKRALDGILSLVSAASLVPRPAVEEKQSQVGLVVLLAMFVFAVVGLIGLWLKYRPS